jgi:putative ATPase
MDITGPLAARLRPSSLDEVVGQDHLLGPGAGLRLLVESGQLPSLLLYGPPGTGKTTIGRLLADAVGATFVPLNSTIDGVARVREVVTEAAARTIAGGGRTVIFLDEIHRFDKRQQDALLPSIESGTIVLIGATTAPPNGGAIDQALLSRLRTMRVAPLDEVAMRTLLARALSHPRGLSGGFTLTEQATANLVGFGAGDARRALGILDAAAAIAEGRTGRRRPDAAGDVFADPDDTDVSMEAIEITGSDVGLAAQSPTIDYDRSGVISALIKSIRGNDPDAALWWLATAIAAGEDPLHIGRRLVISASEDIGNATPSALPLATAAVDAVRFIGLDAAAGMMEGYWALAQVTAFLSSCPKSPRAGQAGMEAFAMVVAHGSRRVPSYLRPAAKTYRHPAGEPRFDVDQDYLPKALLGTTFYHPSNEGAEATLAARLTELRAARLKRPRRPAQQPDADD